MKSVVAVFLTLAGPYVFMILRSFFDWFWVWYNRGPHRAEERPLLERREAPENDGPAHDLGRAQSTRQANGGSEVHNRSSETETSPASNIRQAEQDSDQPAQNPFAILRSSQSGRETLGKFMKYSLLRGANISGSHVFLMTLLGAAILTVFVAGVVANVFSAQIATDRAALLASSHCGIWKIDEKAGNETVSRADLMDLQKEARAGDYAKYCYSSERSKGFRDCGFFYQPKIDYTTRSQDVCPFASPDICHDGLYSAVSFDTGLVSLNTIGINSEVDYKFRRRTICAPLSMDTSYVRNGSHDNDNPTFYYYFGNITDDMGCASRSTEYTFTTSGKPFDWRVPGYSIRFESFFFFGKLKRD